MCDVIIIGGDLVHHVIFQAPAKPGKGVLVLPTYDGNLLAVPIPVYGFVLIPGAVKAVFVPRGFWKSSAGNSSCR